MGQVGEDIVTVGMTRIRQRYVLGADVPLNNPDWNGPWDCAEYVSWCAFQAYGLVFGAGKPRTIANAEPYSGFWYEEAGRADVEIDPALALDIPGAILIRKPRSKLIGHVAISIGDGKRTLEARSRADGVSVFEKANERLWDRGALLPGVEYVLPGGDLPPLFAGAKSKPKSQPLPPGYLALSKPPIKGTNVAALQRALLAKAVHPGLIDGEFGPLTHAAVVSFQAEHGLEVDGIVGPNTAGALELAFPVVPTPADIAAFEARRPRPTTQVPPPSPPPSGGSGMAVDLVASIALKRGFYFASTVRGVSFCFGRSVGYTDDSHRTGLMQSGRALGDIAAFGAYAAADFTAELGPWAHFIEPTLTAEARALYGTLNTYDRAGFTFGAPQLAAHTPNRNFGPYLRKLLTLPEAALHFPELVLRPDAEGQQTVHLQANGGFRNLEEPVTVVRPNGKKEKQPVALMKYLNSDPAAIDGAETTAAARLINWLRLDRRVALLQIETFIDMARLNLAAAKENVPAFDGRDWRIAIWIMDILHQGRGSYAQIRGALRQPDPAGAISRIGEGSYGTRVRTVRDGVKKLAQSGIMNGFEV